MQATRACLKGAGKKMADASRKQLTTTLVALLGSEEDSTRMAAAGCLGTLCASLPEEELTQLLKQQLLGESSICVMVFQKSCHITIVCLFVCF